jgi:hypothetical protein
MARVTLFGSTGEARPGLVARLRLPAVVSRPSFAVRHPATESATLPILRGHRGTCMDSRAPYIPDMLSTELSRTALELPAADRLELARRLVESVVDPVPLTGAVSEGIRRIEDIAGGQVVGLTEGQYRTAVR